MKPDFLRRLYDRIRQGLTLLFLSTTACCLAVLVLIWYFELFDDVPTRVLISVLVAIVPLGIYYSQRTWELKEEVLWLASFLAITLLLVSSDKFNWPVLTVNGAMSFVALPCGWLVWKLMRRNWLLLTGLALALGAMMIYWMAALIGEPDLLKFLLLPLPVVLLGGILWTPLALWILDSARRRKSHRVGGPGMQALAMAILFLPVTLVAVAVPGMFELGQVWTAVSLTLVGVLLSAVVAEPLRRFLLEWGDLAPGSHDSRKQP